MTQQFLWNFGLSYSNLENHRGVQVWILAYSRFWCCNFICWALYLFARCKLSWSFLRIFGCLTLFFPRRELRCCVRSLRPERSYSVCPSACPLRAGWCWLCWIGACTLLTVAPPAALICGCLAAGGALGPARTSCSVVRCAPGCFASTGWGCFAPSVSPCCCCCRCA